MKKVVETKIEGGILWNVLEENGQYMYEAYKQKKDHSFEKIEESDLSFSSREDAKKALKECIRQYAKETE